MPDLINRRRKLRANSSLDTKAGVEALLREGKQQSRDEIVGDVMVKLAAPDADVRVICGEYSLSESTIRGIQNQLRRQLLPVKMQIRKVTNQHFVDKADTIVDMSLERMHEALPHAPAVRIPLPDAPYTITVRLKVLAHRGHLPERTCVFLLSGLRKPAPRS